MFRNVIIYSLMALYKTIKGLPYKTLAGRLSSGQICKRKNSRKNDGSSRAAMTFS